MSALCETDGGAFFTDHLHFVFPAFEITGKFVRGLSGEFVGIAVGLPVDIR